MSVWADVKRLQQPLATTPDDVPSSVWAIPDEPMEQSGTNTKNIVNHFGDGPGSAITPEIQKRIGDPTPEQQNIAHDQEQLAKVRWNQEHPWGTAENHPGHLGKLAHVFSTIGNIAGNIVAPNVMARIPGTQLGMQEQAGELEHNIDTEQQHEAENEQKHATAGNLESETQTRNAELPFIAPQSEAKTRLANAQATELEQTAAAGPNLAIGHAHAVNQAIARGVDPANDPLVQQYEDAIQRIQKQPAAKDDSTKTATYIPSGGTKPMEFQWNPKSNKYDIPMGEHYERPITVNNNQEHKEKGEIVKTYQPALDSAERFNVMAESYEKAVKDHDQQAMLNLLANHLGMTMGLQKGARITKDLYQEAAHSTPWLQKIGAQFSSDGYLSGVTLNPPQMRQMVALAQSRYSEDVKKARATAKYLGSSDDGPGREANDATMRYYLFHNGKDPNKAREAMKADGWTF